MIKLIESGNLNAFFYLTHINKHIRKNKHIRDTGWMIYMSYVIFRYFGYFIYVLTTINVTKMTYLGNNIFRLNYR